MLTRLRTRGWLCWTGVVLTSVLLSTIILERRTFAIDDSSVLKTGRTLILTGREVGYGWFELPVNGWPMPARWASIDASRWPDVHLDPSDGGVPVPMWLVLSPLMLLGVLAIGRMRMAAVANAFDRSRRRVRRAVQLAGFCAVVSLVSLVPPDQIVSLGGQPTGWYVGRLGDRPIIAYTSTRVLAMLQAMNGLRFLSDEAAPSGSMAVREVRDYAIGRRLLVSGGQILDLWLFRSWVPLAAIGLPTLIACWRSRAVLRPESCPSCGYDLTGQPAPGCPECGAGRTPITNTGLPAEARA